MLSKFYRKVAQYLKNVIKISFYNGQSYKKG